MGSGPYRLERLDASTNGRRAGISCSSWRELLGAQPPIQRLRFKVIKTTSPG